MNIQFKILVLNFISSKRIILRMIFISRKRKACSSLEKNTNENFKYVDYMKIRVAENRKKKFDYVIRLSELI